VIEGNGGKKSKAHNTTLTKEGRVAFIQRAQVWTRTDVPSMNLRAGPAGPGAFEPNQTVTCDYLKVHMRFSRKFHCVLPDGDVVKVRYGAHNGEVEASVVATRLLWALGFAADRVYPVRVECRGCSADPWNHKEPVGEVHEFELAAIERKPRGHEMRKGDRRAGWTWPELNLVDERQGGAPPAQRDALKLLAVFMQHSDTHPRQQRLLCLSGGLTDAGGCDEPFLLVHDVGRTFGRANMFNRMGPGSANLHEWAKTSVWRDPAGCTGSLSRSFTGNLGDPHISEEGRSFLAGLLVQLSDRQLRDLFEVARVDQRTAASSHLGSEASVDDWVAVFDKKRNEIVTHRCTS
jgi:hypothetical protein